MIIIINIYIVLFFEIAQSAEVLEHNIVVYSHDYVSLCARIWAHKKMFLLHFAPVPNNDS